MYTLACIIINSNFISIDGHNMRLSVNEIRNLLLRDILIKVHLFVRIII